MNDIKFIETLKQKRNACDYSQSRLALELQISRQNLNEIENGKTKASKEMKHILLHYLDYCNCTQPFTLTIDYLRVRFPTTDALEIIKNVLAMKSKYFIHEDYGMFGYEEQYIYGDISVNASKDSSMGVLLELRGMGTFDVTSNALTKEKKSHDFQLSKDGSREIVYGQSVHRDEFGISKGTFWSPNGELLAFYRMDQSMVTNYPQVNIPEIGFNHPETQSCIATPAPDKYPMTGETSHKVTVGVFDCMTGKTIYLKAGDPTDRYFTNIAWSPDSKTIYMFELNRDQNDCRLTAYNAETGEKTGELYRETDEKYVEPCHPIQFLPWDSNSFIMQSRKNGYNHLYLCEVKNEERKTKNSNAKSSSEKQENSSLSTLHSSLTIRQLTSGKWEVMEVLGFNSKRKSIIIASNEKSPIQRNIFAVDTKTGKRTLVDDCGKGWHSATLSENGQYVFDNYSTPTVPRKIALVNTENGKRTAYFTAENPWKGYNVPEYSCGSIKAADGETDLYWRMVKPVNFDPNKKYPTIIYVYGGPHAHNVDARWNYSSRGWETYMAEKGYLLFILDNRGSENRGKAFEQATFRQLGQIEMQDQMKGVEYLKTLPYVDADKIGVHGWSFGGFMTISLMTNHPDVFKVGVAGGPVIDLAELS